MGAAIASAVVGLSQMSNAKVAEAGVDGDVVLGGSNNTAAATRIDKAGGPANPTLTVTNNNGDGFDATSTTSYGVNALGIPAGVLGVSATAGGIGVWGQLFPPATLGQGVLGSGAGVGVWGSSSGAQGVQGSSSASHGVFGQTSANFASGVSGNAVTAQGVGVTGQSGPGIGVSASSTSNAALFAVSGSSTAVIGRTTTGKAAEFFGAVEITGDFTASGMKSAAVRVADGSVRRMYCLESPVSYFEDMGTGQVTGGSGSVTLDPMFVSTVSTDDYFVYLTPEGDCRGLYVESKSPNGFTVGELMGGSSTLKFSWRVVAKRTGITNERFAPVSMSLDKNAGPKLAPQHVPEVPDVPTLKPNNLPR